MRLCSFRSDNRVVAGVGMGAYIVSVQKINRQHGTDFAPTLDGLIALGQIDILGQVLDNAPQAQYASLPSALTPFCALYTPPGSIWGLGPTAPTPDADLQVLSPTASADDLPPLPTIIGPGEAIVLPPQVESAVVRVATGIIVGRRCHQVTLAEVPGKVLGFTLVIQVTPQAHGPGLAGAEVNTVAEQTVVSLGPWLVTLDEITDLTPRSITTLCNGVPTRSDRLAEMAYTPYDLVGWYAQAMPLQPGDLIAYGRPETVVVQPGDRLGCTIEGIGHLENPVARRRWRQLLRE